MGLVEIPTVEGKRYFRVNKDVLAFIKRLKKSQNKAASDLVVDALNNIAYTVAKNTTGHEGFPTANSAQVEIISEDPKD